MKEWQRIHWNLRSIKFLWVFIGTFNQPLPYSSTIIVISLIATSFFASQTFAMHPFRHFHSLFVFFKPPANGEAVLGRGGDIITITMGWLKENYMCVVCHLATAITRHQNKAETYCELSNFSIVNQMMLCLWGDSVGQSLLEGNEQTFFSNSLASKSKQIYEDFFLKQTARNRSTFIYFIPRLFCQTPTYITELPRQHAQLVDGVQGHHCHGGHGQTPAHHVCPRRKHVGVVDWRVERGKAHHHHELWENVFRTERIENTKVWCK